MDRSEAAVSIAISADLSCSTSTPLPKSTAHKDLSSLKEVRPIREYQPPNPPWLPLILV